MAGLLALVAPRSVQPEVDAEAMAAMTATILAEPGHPMEAAIPVYRACIRTTFEAAAADCGFTVDDLDTQVRIACWRQAAARLVYAYRRLTRRAFLAQGGEA